MQLGHNSGGFDFGDWLFLSILSITGYLHRHDYALLNEQIYVFVVLTSEEFMTFVCTSNTC